MSATTPGDEILVDPPASSPRFQFSLSRLLIAVSAIGVFFAIAARFPELTAISVLMPALVIAPLVVTKLILTGVAYFVENRVQPTPAINNAHLRSRVDWLLVPLRMLGLVQPNSAPTLLWALITAVVATVTVVGLWPIVRELGLTISLISLYTPARLWQYIERDWPSTFSSAGYWKRLCFWELWSVSRWWLLFGMLSLAWWAISGPLARWWPHERWFQTLTRLGCFAPWLIVLEMAFLVGVWIGGSSVVPEPSTGFVVGIFSWDRWHWDCWLDREWLIRGAVPTIVVGTVFFSRVLRWHWLAAIVGAVCLVPVAIMLSIATTVLYLDVRY